jgi:uncharacterized membrane protein YkvA (DUF1232 family)
MKRTCILEQIVVCKFLFFRDRLVTFLPSITLKRITLKTLKTMGKTSIIDIAVLKEKVQEYAMKVGRISARPVLLLYFVMVSKDTPKSDKLMILSTISYLVLPIDLVSAKRLPVIGWIDEAFSLSVAFQKVSKNVTPEIEWKTDKLLDKWFPEYTNYIEVFD